MLEGEVVLQTSDVAVLLRPGDYGLVPVGVGARLAQRGKSPARWADMLAPSRALGFGDGHVRVPTSAGRRRPSAGRPGPANQVVRHIRPEHMDPRRQSQDLLAVSASMRTALLVYSGISVKMMVDSDLGAVLSTMFMVQYEPDGAAGRHDHPFEETYLILDGPVDATFDGDHLSAGARRRGLGRGGLRARLRRTGRRPVRWLETQAPQPPSRHSYRFARDWDYLAQVLEGGDPDE